MPYNLNKVKDNASAFYYFLWHEPTRNISTCQETGCQFVTDLPP